MKLNILIIATVAHSALASGIRTVTDVFSVDEVTQILENKIDNGCHPTMSTKNRQHLSKLAAEPMNRLFAAVGLESPRSESRELLVKSLDLRTMYETTPKHVDVLASNPTVTLTADDAEVAFVFLNDNPSAHFLHGSDRIGVEAGKLVIFSGHVEHNTVVDEGMVIIAGPFSLDGSFERITGPVEPVGAALRGSKDSKNSDDKDKTNQDQETNEIESPVHSLGLL